jgi:hypothetical protein
MGTSGFLFFTSTKSSSSYGTVDSVEQAIEGVAASKCENYVAVRNFLEIRFHTIQLVEGGRY